MSEWTTTKLGPRSFLVEGNGETFRCWRSGGLWSVEVKEGAGWRVDVVKAFRNFRACLKYIQGGAVQAWVPRASRVLQ